MLLFLSAIDSLSTPFSGCSHKVLWHATCDCRWSNCASGKCGSCLLWFQACWKGKIENLRSSELKLMRCINMLVWVSLWKIRPTMLASKLTGTRKKNFGITIEITWFSSNSQRITQVSQITSLSRLGGNVSRQVSV